MQEQVISLMQYPYGTYLMNRLEFVLLRDDELQAQIMRIIEGWMFQGKIAWQKTVYDAINEGKPLPPEPKEYWVTISLSQMIVQLYKFDSEKSNKKTLKEGKPRKNNTISKNTLRKALHALIDDDIVLVRAQPGKEFEAAQYMLNRPLIQKLMNQLPKNPLAILGTCENFTLSTEGEVQTLKVGGGSNFEGGGVQVLKVGHSKSEGGDIQSLNLLIDTETDCLNIQETEEDTAHTPSGGDAQSFSPSSTYPKGRTPQAKQPRGTNQPPQEKVNTPPAPPSKRVAKPVEPDVQRVMEAMDVAMGVAFMWSAEYKRCAKLIAEDGGTNEQIAIVIAGLKQNAFYRDQITPKLVQDKWAAMLCKAGTISKPANASSAETLPASDPNVPPDPKDYKSTFKYQAAMKEWEYRQSHSQSA